MRLDELAAQIGCSLEGDPAIEVSGINTVRDAGPGEVTFVIHPRYRRYLRHTQAAAVICGPDLQEVPVAALRSRQPYLSLARALALFENPCPWPAGVHPTAVIAPSARIGADARIGPYAVIGEDVRIGNGARIGAHVVIYPGARIGDRFVAHAGVTVRERVEIGDDVIIQAGAVIGSEGFGYVAAEDGSIQRVPQIGTVVLEDGVEVGANTTIDRATVGVTRVGREAKLDNLVMVAHGCDVGERAFLAAQVGLAGSTRVGRGVQMGGQAGAAGHLEIGDGARVAAQSGIASDVPAGRTVGGYPAVEIAQWRRVTAALGRLPELLRRVRRLERELGGDREEGAGGSKGRC